MRSLVSLQSTTRSRLQGRKCIRLYHAFRGVSVVLPPQTISHAPTPDLARPSALRSNISKHVYVPSLLQGEMLARLLTFGRARRNSVLRHGSILSVKVCKSLLLDRLPRILSLGDYHECMCFTSWPKSKLAAQAANVIDAIVQAFSPGSRYHSQIFDCGVSSGIVLCPRPSPSFFLSLLPAPHLAEPTYSNAMSSMIHRTSSSDSKEKDINDVRVVQTSDSDDASIREHQLFGSTSAQHRKLGELYLQLGLSVNCLISLFLCQNLVS